MQRIQNIWNSSIDRNYVHENNDSITEDNSDIEKSGDDMNVNKNDDNKVPISSKKMCEKFCLQIWSQTNFFNGVQSKGHFDKTFRNCSTRSNTPTKESA